MDYTALYRKYRPRRFGDLVGQEHIARTLQNAIGRGKIAHAYLFCGPRGTGKTSAAQIMSRAVNCLSPIDNEPCGECEACKRILSSSSLDVAESDAASNRGIDDMRELRERVKFAPAQERYKVYIIDEVHMLTTEAFNALLKTLEEPPDQVIFILATTEPHKVPVTVLSRCQRFDFHRIGAAAITAHLAKLCELEGVAADQDALELISRRAEGGLRDAISLLDQCMVATYDGKITVKTISKVLGTVDEAFVAELAVSIASCDALAVIKGIDVLVSEGRDLRQFLQQLLECVREQLLLGISRKGKPLIESRRALQLLRDLVDADQRLRNSLTPRLTLEIALLTACRLEGQPQANAAAPQARPAGAPASQAAPKAAPKSAPRPPAAQAAAPTVGRVGGNEAQTAVPTAGEVPAELRQALLTQVKRASVVCEAFMKMAVGYELKDKVLTLSFAPANRIHKEGVDSPENKSKIEQAVSQVLGRLMTVETKLLDS